MSKQKHTPEQIVRILREAETTDEPVEAFCRRKEISTVSYYSPFGPHGRWRAKYGGLDVIEAKAQPLRAAPPRSWGTRPRRGTLTGVSQQRREIRNPMLGRQK